MHLTLQADYSLRALLYLAGEPDRLVPTAEIARAYGISSHHMVKVIHHLRQVDLIVTRRGPSGGSRLARAPEEIPLGEVLRATEPGLDLVECFDPEENTCPIAPACGLKGVLSQARDAFLAVLDGKTLADIARPRTLVALREHFLPVDEVG